MADLRRLTLAEAQSELRAQGVADRDVATICPVCGTVQSMRSLVAAGAARDTVDRYFGFSCEGRFSDAGPWPSERDKSARAKKRRAQRGCDWTLGGLLTIHQLTIVYPDGQERPSFEISSPEQAQQLAAMRSEVADA